MSELKEELKAKIIEQLNLEDVSVAEIADDDPLFGDGLGLDSIDALELIVMLDKDYGIRLSDPKEGRKIFESVEVMASYIEEHRTK
ncbi:phosphopantetheine-binding protein [Aequorivita viscosa]|uniref:Acyl carrier protein n=1 Tax=Aequorivita viscosa TaxID=797419 RepID=A0A1M6KTH0_9FLAO|nr:phosphopantetheine-binding protein [Aequorivita viscosa]SDX04049.1 acyl carrier protein [Aequorivita viscosa]SHJ62278.1 acyl carrier protein [Aequorivita viscosa]